MDYNQRSRWSDNELKLIRSVFQNKEFIYAVRDVMTGFTDTFDFKTTPETIVILRKNLLPAVNSEVPIRFQKDLCLDSLKFISGFNAEQGILRIKAFDIAEDYLERRFSVILGKEDKGESIQDLKNKEKADGEERFVRMLAYMILTEYIESSLDELCSIADNPEETLEEKTKRLKANSSK